MILPAMFDAVLCYTRLNGLCVIATVSMVSNVPQIIAYKRPQRTFQSQNYVASCRHGAAHRLARAGDWGKCLTYRLDSLIVIGHHEAVWSRRWCARLTSLSVDANVVAQKITATNGSQVVGSPSVPFFWSSGPNLPLRPVRSEVASALGMIPAEPQIGRAGTQCPGHASLSQACHWTHTSLQRGRHRRPARTHLQKQIWGKAIRE